jgi:hypothetical protein
MRLEIHGFEPSTVNSDGSQTLEPSNRLNRIEKTVQQTVPGSPARTTDNTLAPPSSHSDWLPTRPWCCPQCSAPVLTRAAGPRCPCLRERHLSHELVFLAAKAEELCESLCQELGAAAVAAVVAWVARECRAWRAERT